MPVQVNTLQEKILEHIDFKNFKVDCYKNDQFEDNGYGGNVLGSPINALKWLVNELGLYKVKLLKGQIVLTGTCVKPFTVAPGDEVLMDFGELGKVSCSFSQQVLAHSTNL